MIILSLQKKKPLLPGDEIFFCLLVIRSEFYSRVFPNLPHILSVSWSNILHEEQAVCSQSDPRKKMLQT